ncbi:MAG: hypothetical protein R2847_10140 [Bacteroidia bacterium]
MTCSFIHPLSAAFHCNGESEERLADFQAIAKKLSGGSNKSA